MNSTKIDTFSNSIALIGLVGASISIVLFGIALTNAFMVILLLGCLLSPRLYRLNEWKLLPAGLWFGLALFAWMAFSALWSVGEPEFVSETLRKYREFLFLPVMWIVAKSIRGKVFASEAMYFALLASVFATYALWLDWMHVSGAHLSLKNRIFFGVSTSVFFYWSLLRLSEGGWRRYIAWVAVPLSLGSLLFIETGRTGYVMTVTLLLWYLATQLSSTKLKMAGVVFAIAGIGAAYYLHSGFNSRVNQSVSNTVAYFESGKGSSIGYRLEFYRNAIESWKMSPVVGNGVGSYRTTVEQVGDPERPWGVGDNPHQQYLLFAAEGGALAFVLFIGFLLTYGFRSLRHKDRILQGVVIAMAISCLFNSSFLDSGDSHFYWLMLLLLASSSTYCAENKSA